MRTRTNAALRSWRLSTRASGAAARQGSSLIAAASRPSTSASSTRTTTTTACWRCTASFFSSAPQSPTIAERDAVIVGGGPAGLVLTAALASSEALSSTGHSITLIEGGALDSVQGWEPEEGAYSNRVSSITADNVAFLERIGVWHYVDQSRTCPIEDMTVWDGLSGARIHFSSPRDSTTAFSHVERPMATLVENINLQRAALRAIADSNATVQVLQQAKVAAITPDEKSGWPVLTLDSSDTEQLRARLLIGADGANSPVKKYSGIDTFGWAYDNHGLVATLKVTPGSARLMRTAWQRFLPEGPVAFLPLSDDAASLVWSTKPEIAAALKRVPLEALTKLVNAAFSAPHSELTQLYRALKADPAQLESLLAASPSLSAEWSLDADLDALPPQVASIQPATVASFPLRLSHVSEYLGAPRGEKDARTALVGDAAHTVHPLAGQGLNMGLGDVQALVNTLNTVIEAGGDIGAYNSLRTYPRARYLGNQLMLSATDSLAKLYSTQNSLAVWARSTGLEAVNEVDALKRVIMGQAGSSSGEPSMGIWGHIANGIDRGRDVVDLGRAASAYLLQSAADRLGRKDRF